MGFAEECPPGASVAGNSGKEIAHLEPTRCLQVVYDHGNQSKGILSILWTYEFSFYFDWVGNGVFLGNCPPTPLLS